MCVSLQSAQLVCLPHNTVLRYLSQVLLHMHSRMCMEQCQTAMPTTSSRAAAQVDAKPRKEAAAHATPQPCRPASLAPRLPTTLPSDLFAHVADGHDAALKFRPNGRPSDIAMPPLVQIERAAQ